MNLLDLADVLNKTIIVRRYANQNERWTASMEYCETKEDAGSGILAGTYGDGVTPAAALNDYTDQIVGKVLVFNAASTERRQQFVCPKLAHVEIA
jgi:hypothetical protein